MLYREIIAVCSQIHSKHINTLSGQNANVQMVDGLTNLASPCSTVTRRLGASLNSGTSSLTSTRSI